MPNGQHQDKLRQLLARGPAKASALLAELGISQPTLSRLWASIDEGVVFGASKARHYALRRDIADIAAPLPLFRVDEAGQVSTFGHLTPLLGGWYALTTPGSTGFRLFKGLPYFLQDLHPQGFLGRLEPARYPELNVPADILRWTDEHVLRYIARRSEYAAGDLIVGNESYARYLASAANARASLLPNALRAARYPALAEQAMRGDPPGSSAGGEQPKFTAAIVRGDAHRTVDHVIVKFSPPMDTPGGRRWGDLLVCEHLALAVLHRHQIAAARTAVLDAGGRIFLEVVRFDRSGLTGRRPMATLSAFDGDLGMLDQSWTAVARALGERGALPLHDVHTVELLDLYGTLIGNTDKHHGNIALAWQLDGRHRLLDAYDMLPMLYRPTTHGEIVDRRWTPNLAARLELRHLPQCAAMAEQFWNDVVRDKRISDAFKQTVATPHIATLRQLCNIG